MKMKMVSLLYAHRFSFMVFCCLNENVLNSILGIYTYVGILLLFVNIYVAVVTSLIYEKGIKVFCKLVGLNFTSGLILLFILFFSRALLGCLNNLNRRALKGPKSSVSKASIHYFSSSGR